MLTREKEKDSATDAAPIKDCARRFAIRAYGVLNRYIACDLDEGILRYWPKAYSDPNKRLLYSRNSDERNLGRYLAQAEDEDAYCIGVELTTGQIERLESLLSSENIESMRGIDDQHMGERSRHWCYRDGWWMDFYAEGDAGWPPLDLTGLGWCSFVGDELPFEKVEQEVQWNILGDKCEAFLYDVSKKLPKEKTDNIVERAIEVGLSAIEQVLWDGTPRLITSLAEARIGRHLSYSYSGDSFTVRFGNELSRACKAFCPPACVGVLGASYTFEE